MLIQIRNFLVQAWFRFKRPMTLGARVIAIDSDGRVCLIRHTYTPGWHLPGGGVERGETCLQAAIKEAREEAGLIIEANDLQLVSIHANFDNFPGDHVTIFLTRNWVTGSTDNALEIAECAFFALNDLPLGTTGGTKRRLAELAGAKVSPSW
jgi:ADP-ribose pyrophosphatase YjhB (NUDIX family)